MLKKGEIFTLQSLSEIARVILKHMVTLNTRIKNYMEDSDTKYNIHTRKKQANSYWIKKCQ